jgi:fatty-acyl-CoA synthase
MSYLFSEWLRSLAAQYGDKPAVTCGVTMTFRELWEASGRCAVTLAEAGVRKGDKVVLWAYNGADWVVFFFGIAMAGGIATLMNYGLKAEEVTQLTEMTHSVWAIIGENKVSAADRESAVRVLSRGGVDLSRIIQADELFSISVDSSRPVDEAALRKLEQQMQPGDTQLIIFTTGTTSLPKGVQLSSRSVLKDAGATFELLKNDMTSSICDALPLFHSFGLSVLMIWLGGGNHVYLLPRLKPEIIEKQIRDHRIEALASVGAIYNGLMQLAQSEEMPLGSLRTCLVGGGFTTPTEMMRMENALDGGKLLIAYGQTECSPIISVNIGSDPVEKRAATVGRVIPGVRVGIWREESGLQEPGKIGEIVVKGPVTMNGYLDLPAEQQPFDPDGWLHTGDLGFIDPDGLLVIAGRIKDIIIRSGENISPMEVEKAILELDAVREAKVLGAPHPIWGESVEACIVTDTGTVDEAAMKAALRDRLSSYKIPSHFFSYPSFPLNTNGKLDQRSLKTSMLEKVRAAYIRNALDDGLKILCVQVGNRMYTITPVCDMVQELAGVLGFAERQRQRIRLAVEEMITERIANAYDTRGEITLEIILMPQWLRARFTDTGKPYRLDDKDASLSARIILANVDAYSSASPDGKQVSIHLDWQYAEGFDIHAWLARYGEEGKA